MAHEIEQYKTTEQLVDIGEDRDLLIDMLQGEIGLSPLAVGTKFETDDLLKSPRIHLSAFHWVDYYKNEGTPEEEHVRFALWAVTVDFVDKKNEVTTETGYYQGGHVLNKIATAIERKNGLDAFNKHGLDVQFRKDKTSSGNPIVLVEILR